MKATRLNVSDICPICVYERASAPHSCTQTWATG